MTLAPSITAGGANVRNAPPGPPLAGGLGRVGPVSCYDCCYISYDSIDRSMWELVGVGSFGKHELAD